MAKFVYDKEHLRFKLKKVTFWSVIWKLFKYFVLSFSAAVLIYVVFALAYDTDREKMLLRENKEMREQYSKMQETMNLVDNAVGNLELRDREIYNAVFNSDPPRYGLLHEDSTQWQGDLYEKSEKKIIEESDRKLQTLEGVADKIDVALRVATEVFAKKANGVASIPSIIPIRNFTILQTGASVGKKVNPFFKTVRDHNGIDLMAPVGSEVVCTADGFVIDVEKAVRTFGTRVTIEHEDGYVTTYSHLSIATVRRGQEVKAGAMIGRVGLSGTSFAPCLHYEVIRNGKYQEPVNYFFSDLSPFEYDEMLKVAVTTGQSMD